jgi:hypothetical protein
MRAGTATARSLCGAFCGMSGVRFIRIVSVNEKRCRAIVSDRSEGLCERCCRQGHTYHHRKNRSGGGRWSPSNIVFLCGDGVRLCHGWVTTHPTDAGVEGFHVAPWRDPLDVPILWRGSNWAHLDDEGKVIDV